MKYPKNTFAYLLIVIFLITLSNEILNMGLLIWASLQDNDPIKQAAIIGFWASLGYVFAIFVGKYTYKLNLLTLLGGTIFIGLGSLLISPMTPLWGGAILLRSTLGQIVYARVITFLPIIVSKDELTKSNKNIQLAISSAGVLTMILSPLLAKFESIVWIIFISTLLLIAAYLLSFKLKKISNEDKKESSTIPFRNVVKGISWASLMFYLTWIIYGTFFIIEVPLLKLAVNASPLVITLFLAIGMMTNLLTTKLIRPEHIDKYGSRLFSVACLGLVVFSFTYINSRYFLPLFVSAFILGAWNALMNITIYTKVQHLKNDYSRESRYVVYRLICELGIFTGVMCVYFINKNGENIYSLLGYLSVIIFFLVFLVSFYIRFDPFKKEFLDEK